MADVQRLGKRSTCNLKSVSPTAPPTKHKLRHPCRPTSKASEHSPASAESLQVRASLRSTCARCSVHARITPAWPAAPYTLPESPVECVRDRHTCEHANKDRKTACARS